MENLFTSTSQEESVNLGKKIIQERRGVLSECVNNFIEHIDYAILLLEKQNHGSVGVLTSIEIKSPSYADWNSTFTGTDYQTERKNIFNSLKSHYRKQNMNMTFDKERNLLVFTPYENTVAQKVIDILNIKIW